MRQLRLEEFIKAGVSEDVAKTLVLAQKEAASKTQEDKAHQKAHWKAYREAHPDQIKANEKAYRETHQDQVKARRKAYRETHRDQAKVYQETHQDQIRAKTKVYRENHQDQIRDQNSTRSRSLRLEVLQHYGRKCACCGETAIEFLEIDHINGGGTKHRRETVKGSIFRWLKNNDYPPEFQILCANCNLSRAFYGYCPHQGKAVEVKNLEEGGLP